MKRRRLLFIEMLIVVLLFCLYSCNDQTINQLDYTYESVAGQIKAERMIQ